MNLLILGVGDEIFRAGDGNAQERLQQYLALIQQREPGSRMVNLVATTSPQQSLVYPGLEIVPVKARQVQLFPLLGWRILRQRQDVRQFDLITAQNPLEVGLLAWLVARRYSIPFELQIHFNLFSPYWLQEHLALNRLRLALAKFLLKRADRVRVVSSPIAAGLNDKWGIAPQKVHVTPVPVFFFAAAQRPLSLLNQLPAHVPVLLFVGRLCYQKNLPGLLQVIRQVSAHCPQAHFLLVGSGPLQAFLAQEVARLPTNNVHLVGSIAYDELPACYQRADIVLLPSLSEGFGRVLLEGYLFQTPAVATASGGTEDIIRDGETGFLTPVADMPQFAQKVNWLLDHPEERQRMGQRGYDYVRRTFEPTALMQRIVDNWFVTAGHTSANLAVKNRPEKMAG